MAIFIYLLWTTLALSCLLDGRTREPERHFSFGIVRVLLMLPLLAGVYLFVSASLQTQLVGPLFFSENVFSLMWLFMAYRLRHAILPVAAASTVPYLAFIASGVVVIGAAGYWLFSPPAAEIAGEVLLFPRYGQLYLSSLFMLMAVFFMAWRLEIFWRTLEDKNRWPYKYLVIGFFLVCGSLFWSTSYRLLYRQLDGDVLLLLAAMLLIAWLFILYAVIRHRLLNRKLFVSRKVIYTAAAPLIFAGYLILLGLATMVMRSFGWSLPYFLQWLLIVSGLLFVIVLVFSGKVRSSVKFFISTHFYVNKYEYRDEWLTFSSLLQGTLTEREVAEALRHILSESLYTRKIMIWLGDTQSGFRLIDAAQGHVGSNEAAIAADDPLVLYLQHEPVFYTEVSGESPLRHRVTSEKSDFFRENGLVLMAPLTIGGQCMGLIGLGPEYTGGRYGRDDFDLLSALGSQAAAAIFAARAAEELAQAREKSAWDTLSTFVLHDIKNAATMLNLVRENAPAHIHKPEFQRDLLASVDDALKRMNKVQQRLKTLQGDTAPTIEAVDFGHLVSELCGKLVSKLPQLTVEVHCQHRVMAYTDPEIIAQILENLMINALEAGGPGTSTQVEISTTDQQTIQLEITDNGPGIPRLNYFQIDFSTPLKPPSRTAAASGSGRPSSWPKASAAPSQRKTWPAAGRNSWFVCL